MWPGSNLIEVCADRAPQAPTGSEESRCIDNFEALLIEGERSAVLRCVCGEDDSMQTEVRLGSNEGYPLARSVQISGLEDILPSKTGQGRYPAPSAPVKSTASEMARHLSLKHELAFIDIEEISGNITPELTEPKDPRTQTWQAEQRLADEREVLLLNLSATPLRPRSVSRVEQTSDAPALTVSTGYLSNVSSIHKSS